MLCAKLAFAAKCMNEDEEWKPGAFRCGGAAGSDISGAEAVPGKQCRKKILFQLFDIKLIDLLGSQVLLYGFF